MMHRNVSEMRGDILLSRAWCPMARFVSAASGASMCMLYASISEYSYEFLSQFPNLMS